MSVYVVMQWKGPKKHPEFQGVFSSQENAEQACRNKNYFIWATKMNKILPHKGINAGPTLTWFPKIQDRGCPYRRTK